MTDMRHSLIPKLTLAGLLAAASGLALAGPALAKPAPCSAPALSKPFLSWGDSHSYFLAPGQSADNFSASGWALSGGAKVIATRLADGTTGHVLDLPSGAKAISPAVCVNSSYPDARAMVQSVGETASLSVSVYLGQPSFKISEQLHGQANSWTLSNPFALPTASLTGWQLAHFEFASSGKGSVSELYNFYLDPYSKSVAEA